METEQFNKIVQERVDASLKGLLKKAEEYAGPSDRLHNFKVAKELGPVSQTYSQALSGMMVKHTVSVYDMINSGEAYSEEMWDEKIGDHINYLLLLRATIVEDGLVNEPLAQWEKDLLKDAPPVEEKTRTLLEAERDLYFHENAEKGSTFSARCETFIQTGDDRCLKATFFG